MIFYHNKTEWFNSFDDAYRAMLKLVHDRGHVVHPRQGGSLGATKEILNACFAIPANKPLCTIKERGLSYAFAMLEPFFLFTHQKETDIVTPLTTYAPNLTKLAYNDKTKEFDGNYGDRIHLSQPVLLPDKTNDYIPSETPLHLDDEGSQLRRCYRLLANDLSSRRAILTIHNPVWDVIDGDSKDIPCTLNLQFLVRDSKLHCICTMRSNDIWYGTPHNVMMFTFLQRALAGWLGIPTGDYIHRANSLHMYQKHWEKALVVMHGKSDETLPQEIVYPTHCHPEVTYEAAKGMIAWEKEYRENGGKPVVAWQPKDVYERKTCDAIEAFLVRSMNEPK